MTKEIIATGSKIRIFAKQGDNFGTGQSQFTVMALTASRGTKSPTI